MSENMNRQKLCSELGVSESTVRRLEILGLPYTPVGLRSKRYDLAECKQWLRENQCQFGSKKAASMSESWSRASAFTDAFRKRQRRNSQSPQGFSVVPIDEHNTQFIIVRFTQWRSGKEMRSHFRVVFPAAGLAVGVEVVPHFFAGRGLW